MELQKQNEEKLREASCYGDNEALMAILSRGTNVNSKHDINGWTALHWACKRGNASTVKLLLMNGAEVELENNQGQKPAQICTDPEILRLLGIESSDAASTTEAPSVSSLPITPNYLVNPVLEQKVNVEVKKPVVNGLDEGHEKPLIVPSPAHPTHVMPMAQDSARQSRELLLKVRVAHTDDPDFIEVDFQRPQLNYSHLLTTCCRELAVNPQLVERIRKLPNTRLRNDRDVQRLTNLTELELVITGHSRPNHPNSSSLQASSNSTSRNNYKSIHGFKNQTILY